MDNLMVLSQFCHIIEEQKIIVNISFA